MGGDGLPSRTDNKLAGQTTVEQYSDHETIPRERLPVHLETVSERAQLLRSNRSVAVPNPICVLEVPRNLSPGEDIMSVSWPNRLPVALPVLLALVASVAAACGPEATPAANLTVTTDTVGGIVRVTNTGTAPEWQLTQVVSIGPRSLSETGAPEEFGRVNSAALGPDEAVFVADGFNREVRVFGLDGVHRRTLGRNGDGPGEFRSLYSVAWVGDRLLTLDLSLGRLGQFSADGEWLGQQRIEGSVSGSPGDLRLWPVGSDQFFRRGFRRHPTGIESMFIGHDSRGETGDSLRQLEPPPGPAASIYCAYNDGWITAFDIPFGPKLVQHPGSGSVMYSAMTDVYRIAITRGSSDTLRVIERALPSEPISDGEWAAGNQGYEELRAEWPDAECDPRRPSRPATKSFIQDIFIAPDGKLWVEVIRTAGNRWEFFDIEGRLLGTVPAPSRKEGAAPAFGPDHLITIRQDSLDLDHVDVWRVERAGG